MSEDRIDTRDLVDELAELEATPDADRDRAQAIRALFGVLSDYAEDSPEDGIFLIAKDAFEDYAKELAEDIGVAPPDDAGWPLYCIDWKRAARELSLDYHAVDFDGTTYYFQ